MYGGDGSQAAADISVWLQSQGLPPRAVAGREGTGPQLDSAVNGMVEKVATRFDGAIASTEMRTGVRQRPDPVRTTRVVPDRRHRATHRTRDPVGGRLRRTSG